MSDPLSTEFVARTVDRLTSDLNAARDLQKEIDLAVEANREVEAVLRTRPVPPD